MTTSNRAPLEDRPYPDHHRLEHQADLSDDQLDEFSGAQHGDSAQSASNEPLIAMIPEGAKILLSVIGEEDAPVDLAPYASLLLRNHATLTDAELPNHDGETTVDFATLSADDNVTFTRNGTPVEQAIGLSALGDMVVVAMTEALRNHDYNHPAVETDATN